MLLLLMTQEHAQTRATLMREREAADARAAELEVDRLMDVNIVRPRDRDWWPK